METRPTVHRLLGPVDAPAYAWVIDRDYIATKDERALGWDAVGTAGPSWATPEDIEKARKGTRFRLLDDDDEVYFGGSLWYSTGATEDDGNPVHDWAEWYAGATRLQYKNAEGKWEDVIG